MFVPLKRHNKNVTGFCHNTKQEQNIKISGKRLISADRYKQNKNFQQKHRPDVAGNLLSQLTKKQQSTDMRPLTVIGNQFEVNNN